jgi:hypothetical protein
MNPLGFNVKPVWFLISDVELGSLKGSPRVSAGRTILDFAGPAELKKFQ